jgi:hypothetical protein
MAPCVQLPGEENTDGHAEAICRDAVRRAD